VWSISYPYPPVSTAAYLDTGPDVEKCILDKVLARTKHVVIVVILRAYFCNADKDLNDVAVWYCMFY